MATQEERLVAALQAVGGDIKSIRTDLQTESALVSADRYYFATNSLELPTQNLAPINTSASLYRYNRWRISTGSWTARKARFLISNVLVNTNNVVANSSSIIFEGLFIEIAGVVTPITVGGLQEFTVASGASLWTDPLSVDIPPGADVFLRSARRFVQGQTWTGTPALISAQVGDVAQHSSASLFTTASGAVAAQFPQAYSPRPPICAMVARGHSGGPVALVIGSSGSFGAGWNIALSDTRREAGYVRRGLGSAAGGRMTGMILATSGGTFNNTTTALLPWLKQATTILGDVPFNYVHCQLGLNDLSTLGVMQGYLTNMRAYLNANFGALPFVMQTLTPTTSAASATAWTNEAGQSYSSTAFGPDPSNRSLFNDWIRTNPNGMVAFDIAPAVEGVTTSKIKVPAFTTTLAAAVSATPTDTLVTTHAPPIGTILVLEPGTANQDIGTDNERLVVQSVTGTGPYTVKLIGGDYTTNGDTGTTKAHAIGASVVSASTYDGLHFSTYAQMEMADRFASMKGTIRAAVSAPAAQITQAQVQDLDSRFAAVETASVPAGGTAGQLLAKTSGIDHQASWADGPPKGLSGWCSGKPAASEKIGGGTAPYDLTLSAANSKAVADVAATASTVFVIQRAGTQIGTLTFSAGATVGVFSYSSTAITKGQKVRIIAPAAPDATLADIDYLLVS